MPPSSELQNQGFILHLWGEFHPTHVFLDADSNDSTLIQINFPFISHQFTWLIQIKDFLQQENEVKGKVNKKTWLDLARKESEEYKIIL